MIEFSAELLSLHIDTWDFPVEFNDEEGEMGSSDATINFDAVPLIISSKEKYLLRFSSSLGKSQPSETRFFTP